MVLVNLPFLSQFFQEELRSLSGNFEMRSEILSSQVFSLSIEAQNFTFELFHPIDKQRPDLRIRKALQFRVFVNCGNHPPAHVLWIDTFVQALSNSPAGHAGELVVA